ITAIPVSDTVKRATQERLVDRTIDRSDLWRVQTPQAFRYDLLLRAFEKAMADSYYGTDESSLVEYIGQPVKIIMGSLLNIKITRPEDLVLGEKIALLF
ncbi:MAG: 2-C-methyl-D-erythritol 4-phosphate cytidylyltransferase, partial [Nitrospinales bacterium]